MEKLALGAITVAQDGNSNGAAAQIWLTRKEQRLRESLDQGDMPVLGLYIDHFSPEDREYFRSKVLGSADPVKSFIRGLERWPATFATFLTIHLVEGYGQSGNAEVYPYIQTALGIGEESIGPKDRSKLAAAYRRACITLGLSTAPSGEGGRAFVDEYLRQVGVPVPYFKGLFEGLAKVAHRYGVPEVDDANDLAAWEAFVDIPRTRPVLRRAVDNDSGGYYAGLFFSARRQRVRLSVTNLIKVFLFRYRDFACEIHRRSGFRALLGRALCNQKRNRSEAFLNYRLRHVQDLLQQLTKPYFVFMNALVRVNDSEDEFKHMKCGSRIQALC